MQRFQRYDDEGWFRVGTVGVTTGVAVALLCTVSMFVYAIDSSLLAYLTLNTDALSHGEVWRLLTWWMVNPPDIWVAISIAFFWYIGRLVERDLGKARYLWFIGFLVVLPALVTTAFSILTDSSFVLPGFQVGIAGGGADFLEVSVIIAAAVVFPSVRWLWNIPFWVIAAVIVAIDVLRFTGDRVWSYVVMIVSSGVVAALVMRAFGLAEQEAIPKIPLPQFITGDPYQKANRRREKEQKRQRRATASAGRSTGVRRGPKKPAEVIPIRPEPRLDRTSQADMDALLDKISESGIDSLTPDERRRLDDLSRRLRGE